MVEVVGQEDRVSDIITPVLKLVVFNVLLPSLDIYFDLKLLVHLFPRYWGCGLFLLTCLTTNTTFTCLAWWRLDTRREKAVTWVFLLLQVWPQLKALQAILLTCRRDVRAALATEVLDREVASLEPFLEAMPSVCVMTYMIMTSPGFLSSLSGSVNFYRAYYITCFTMTLFLKSGPCFILPRHGLFAGIFTWRFLVVFFINMFSLNSKLLWTPSFEGSTLVLNILCVSAFSTCLALYSLHQSVGSWRGTLGVIVSHPPLLLLPIFGYFTFGTSGEASAEGEQGIVLSWRWTMVNMLVSFALTLVRYLVVAAQVEVRSLHDWVLQATAAHAFSRAKVHAMYFYCLAISLLSILLTLVLYWRRGEAGILLPHLPVHHALHHGAVLPLVLPQPTTYTRC